MQTLRALSCTLPEGEAGKRRADVRVMRDHRACTPRAEADRISLQSAPSHERLLRIHHETAGA